MAISPNYSWPLPDDTDLVKNGALAIRNLGNAIDTTVDGLPGAGLVHIETQTFSAVSSVSFNDVFTSDYRDYFIKFNLTGDPQTTMRLRASAADNSAAVYDRQISTAAGASNGAVSNLNATSWTLTSGPRDEQAAQINLFQPKTNTPTYILQSLISFDTNFASPQFVLLGGTHTDNYEADGFSLLFSVAATGVAMVYGYKD